MAPLSSSSNLGSIATFIIGMIGIIIPVLTTLALALVLYAGVRYSLKASESKGKGPERDALMWGLIALFVIVSVWGILRIMCNTLFGSSTCSSGQTSSFQQLKVGDTLPNGQTVLFTIPR